MADMHPYQISILRELLFKPNARFRDLKKVDIPNDHFSFHLRALIDAGLVEKKGSVYDLTLLGKQRSNVIDTFSKTFEKQGKIGVALHAIRTNKEGELETLVHQRLKQPFYGWWGSHTGKIHIGETPLECAQREFKEETGLTGDFNLKGVLHWIDKDPSGQILEDKYLFLFFITNVQGQLIEQLEEGINKWMTESEFSTLDKTFGSWKSMVEEYNAPELFFKDIVKTRENY